MAALREGLEARAARRRYVPPASPALAPREHAWAKSKTCVRAAQARSREALEMAIQPALTTIHAADAHGWFASGGETVPELENRSQVLSKLRQQSLRHTVESDTYRTHTSKPLSIKISNDDI